MKTFVKKNIFECLAFALAFALYLITVSYGFFIIDDDRFVTQNPCLQFNLRNICMYMGASYADLYTPFTFISLMTDHLIGGDSAWIYHLHNVFLFAVTASLLVVIQKKLGIRGWLAFLFTVLWIVNPQRLESVVWISERKDVLFGFYSSCCVLLIFYDIDKGQKLLWPALLLLFAMLAKPAASGLLAVPIAYSAYRYGWKKIQWRNLVIFFSAYIAYLCLFGWAQRVVHNPPPVPFGRSVSIIVHNILFYLSSAVLPLEVNPIYPLTDWSDPEIIALAAVVILTAFLLAKYGIGIRTFLLKYVPLYGAVWCGFFAATTGIVRYTYADRADRYNYMMSAVVLICFAHLLENVVKQHPEWNKKVVTVSLLPIWWSSFITLSLLPIWSSAEILNYALANTREHSHANDVLLSLCGGYGLSKRNADLCENVSRLYHRKLQSGNLFAEDLPVSKQARLNSALLFHSLSAYLKGNDSEALSGFHQLWKTPDAPTPVLYDSRSYYNIMHAMFYDLLYRNDLYAEAVAFLDAFVSRGIKTDDSVKYFLLGNWAWNHKDYSEALRNWEISLAKNPGDLNTARNIETLKKIMKDNKK